MAKDKTTIRVIKSTDKPKRLPKMPKLPKVSKLGRKKQTTTEKNHRKAPKWLRAIAKPFVATGRYFKLSWIELKQVRWPNRRTTWKLTAMVIVYCIIFAVLITLLDVLFQFIFNRALA
jgi:preprotein translocase subunit SecE